jgi:hypothetical protein
MFYGLNAENWAFFAKLSVKIGLNRGKMMILSS